MYDIEKLLKILTDSTYRVIDENGKVFPPSNEIYASIEMAMDGNPKAKHVYTIVKNNRNGIHDDLLRAFSITLPNESAIDGSFDPNISGTTISVEKFNIIISTTEWLPIKPQETVYNDGKRYVILKPGWTDLFAAKIWEKSRIPCIWSFKNAKGRIKGKGMNASVKIKGTCTECGARIIGLIENYSIKNSDILSQIRIKNYKSDFIHKGRRQLRGNRRLNIAGNLIDTKTDAVTYVRNEAKNLIEFGDQNLIEFPYPPILPKTDVLRKAKSQIQEKRLGITGSLPISNIVDAKDSTHAGIIRKVGASPFFCHYWTKEQKLLYKLNSKRDDSFMTIDATGSIAKKIQYKHEKSKYIFLYQCMSASSVGSAPVFQMLSAEHTAIAITTWLLTILSDDVAIPKMVVCDFSMALLISIAIAFGKKADLQDYMNTCFEIAINKSKIFLATYIRIDVSHLVAIVCRWTCIKKHPFVKVRQFFIRSICHAYQMQEIDNLEYFLESILVVALSHTLTSNSGKLLPSQIRFEYVNSVIKGMPIAKIDETNDEEIEQAKISKNEKEEDKYEEDFKKQRSETWLKWSAKIYEHASNIASQCVDGETLNAYYNLEAAENIKRLMYYLPLWTGIMIPFFGRGNRVATSSSVESEFANIKSRAFKNELPQRADKFIFHHIDYLDGRIKESSTKFIVTKTESAEKNSKASLKELMNHEVNTDINNEINNNIEISTSTISQSSLANLSLSKDNISNIQNLSVENRSNISEENMNINTAIKNKSLEENANEFDSEPKNNPLNTGENWGGKISPDKKRPKRPTYMDPFPDWDFVQSHKFVDIPLLKNGNLCESIKFQNKYICVRNTCAFDSFVQLLAHVIGKEKCYKNCVQDCQLPILQLTKNILTRGKILATDYKTRAEILKEINICKISDTRHIQFLDASCNIDHIIQTLLTDLPSVTRFTKCSSCSYMQCRNLPTLCINVEILLKKGFHYVQEAIDDMETLNINQALCKKCSATLERTHDYGPHLFLDTSVISVPTYNTERKEISLESLTKIIKLGEKNYTLCGIVNYKGNEKKSFKVLGHYTAVTYTGFSWYEYDDLKKKKSYILPQEIVTPHTLMYVQNK